MLLPVYPLVWISNSLATPVLLGTIAALLSCHACLQTHSAGAFAPLVVVIYLLCAYFHSAHSGDNVVTMDRDMGGSSSPLLALPRAMGIKTSGVSVIFIVWVHHCPNNIV